MTEFFTRSAEDLHQADICCKIAATIMARFDVSIRPTEEKGIFEFVVDSNTCKDVLKSFNLKLAPRRWAVMGGVIIQLFSDNYHPSCLFWELAHQLQHIIYEPDLDALEHGRISRP